VYVSRTLTRLDCYLTSLGNHAQYLGPSALQLLHLFLLIVINSLMFFALSILLIRTIWCLAINTTTIEGWEIERHATLVRRARYYGGYLHGPDGQKIRIVKQEFPYDIGIWKNLKQGMGTGNVRSSRRSASLAFTRNHLTDIVPQLVLAACAHSTSGQWYAIRD
jgi:palmitoyltransferase